MTLRPERRLQLLQQLTTLCFQHEAALTAPQRAVWATLHEASSNWWANAPDDKIHYDRELDSTAALVGILLALRSGQSHEMLGRLATGNPQLLPSPLPTAPC